MDSSSSGDKPYWPNGPDQEDSSKRKGVTKISEKQMKEALLKLSPARAWKCATPRLFLAPPRNAIFQSNCRPWANISELGEVRDIIYTLVSCDQNNATRVLTINNNSPDSIGRILYARDRLITWSRRMKNINERPLADDHLRLVGTLFEIVLHIERNGEISTLERLYGKIEYIRALSNLYIIISFSNGSNRIY